MSKARYPFWRKVVEVSHRTGRHQLEVLSCGHDWAGQQPRTMPQAKRRACRECEAEAGKIRQGGEA